MLKTSNPTWVLFFALNKKSHKNLSFPPKSGSKNIMGSILQFFFSHPVAFGKIWFSNYKWSLKRLRHIFRWHKQASTHTQKKRKGEKMTLPFIFAAPPMFRLGVLWCVLTFFFSVLVDHPCCITDHGSDHIPVGRGNLK